MSQPLAARMRPQSVEHFFGQQHLLAPGKPLHQALVQKHLHSMILWGPPGTGKTTLASILAASADAEMEKISAVFSGVKDIRRVVDIAQQRRATTQRDTVLFIDEIHRFNKAQQDAFLPFVEDGTLTLIGATTENPSFELNNALLSRAKVYVLKSLTTDDMQAILSQALQDAERGFGALAIEFPEALQGLVAQAADGDARRCLNSLEILVELARGTDAKITITDEHVAQVLTGNVRRFDKGGDDFYDQISALHKSVRGSDVDASLYWLCRMLDGGCDPHYIARRVLRMASEDIGNADPRALTIALQAYETYERLGSPEGELAIAQAVIYMACAAKSNAVYLAFKAAMKDAKQHGSLPVPLHIRNAPTQLMKSLDYGKNYRYAHDEDGAFAAGEQYFPDAMPRTQYYHPVERGLEIKIKQKLDYLAELNKQASTKQS